MGDIPLQTREAAINTDLDMREFLGLDASEEKLSAMPQSSLNLISS